MYDPKLDEDIGHLWFIMTGAVMCWLSNPLMTLAAGCLCIAIRSWIRWKKGEWTV